MAPGLLWAAVMTTWQRTTWCALLGWWLVAGEARRAEADPCGMSLAELRARAVEHAGLAPSTGLARRARLAGLLPDVSLRAGRGWAWDDPWNGLREPDEGVARRDTVDVRLTWRLGRVLFDPAEPRVQAGERSAARARLDLEDEVTTRYFRWRRAVLDAEDIPGPREDLAAQEAFAALDALTGGWLAARMPCRGGR